MQASEPTGRGKPVAGGVPLPTQPHSTLARPHCWGSYQPWGWGKHTFDGLDWKMSEEEEGAAVPHQVHGA